MKNTNFTNTSAISINNIGISKTIAPNVNDSFGKKDFKYFIRTNIFKNLRPLCILLPKISAYRREFDETKSFETTSFGIRCLFLKKI